MLPLLAAATAAAVATSNEITFAVPFTNDAVLQRGPAVAAVYGLVAHSTTGVKVTVTDDANGSSYTVHATLRPASSAGGTSLAGGTSPSWNVPRYSFKNAVSGIVTAI